MSQPTPFPIENAEKMPAIEVPGHYDPEAQVWQGGKDDDEFTTTFTTTSTNGHNDVDDDSDTD